jgi:peptidoglycan/LPS O-acetylase OafA/YrhL
MPTQVDAAYDARRADSHTAGCEEDFTLYRNRKHFEELDGLRAFCVLLVISTHMADKRIWDWLSGDLGVMIFFVLSGYLISMLALREERKTGAVSLKAFYVRRTFRILPIYFVILAAHAIALLCLGWVPALRAYFVDALPSYFLFYQDFQFAHDVPLGRHSPFAHSWSLGIEEKFYFIWPLLAFVVLRGRTSLRVGAAVLLVWFCMSMRSLHRLPSLSDWHLDVVLFSYYYIALGCLLALLLEDEWWFSRLRFLGNRSWLLAALCLFLALQVAYRFIVFQVPEVQILYGLSVALLIAGIVVGKGPIQQLLRWKPLTFIGSLSYGMYLVHGLGIGVAQKVMRGAGERPEIAVLTYVLACTVTVACAYALAVLVERPFIRIGRRLSQAILANNEVRAASPVCTLPEQTATASGRA